MNSSYDIAMLGQHRPPDHKSDGGGGSIHTSDTASLVTSASTFGSNPQQAGGDITITLDHDQSAKKKKKKKKQGDTNEKKKKKKKSKNSDKSSSKRSSHQNPRSSLEMMEEGVSDYKRQTDISGISWGNDWGSSSDDWITDRSGRKNITSLPRATHSRACDSLDETEGTSQFSSVDFRVNRVSQARASDDQQQDEFDFLPRSSQRNNFGFAYPAAARADDYEEENAFDTETQEEVMRELQSFTEEHMSDLAGDESMSQLHNEVAASNAIADQRQKFSGYSASNSTIGSGMGHSGDTDDTNIVSHELLVNYLLAVGGNRETAERLALSFEAEQNGATAGVAGRRVQPSKMTLSSKQKEVDSGHSRQQHASNSDVVLAALFSVTGQQQQQQQQLVMPQAPSDQAYVSPQDLEDVHNINLAQIVAIAVDECAVNNSDQSNLPIVYADSTPLSIKHMFNERPVRRFACIALIAALCAVIGIVVSFTVFKEDKASTDSHDLIAVASTMAPSTAPTFISDEIQEAAAQISGWGAMEDVTSPQFKAVGWISTFDEIDTRGFGGAFAQRYALVVMYYSFKGENWINQEQWLNPKLHECEWSDGIGCLSEAAGTRAVTGFDATRNNLRGTIPHEVGLLSSSEFFRIPNNNVEGTIPDSFGSMTSLSVADMSRNDLTGSIPSTIGGARDMILINFSGNLLNSTIPSELFSLNLLQTLVLNTNKLSGPLDSSINNLESLVTLDLRHNEISGTFPVTVDSIATLDIIQIDYNQFTGGLPEATNSLARKQIISLSHNKFEGNVDISAEYYLSPNITSFRIQYVDVSYNDLSGPLSPLFAFMPTLRHFDLSGNRFVGNFPSNVGWESIEFLAVASNGMTGTIPVGYPSLTHLDLSDNDFTMGIPEKLCEYPALEFLLLSDNPAGSTVPACLGSLPKIRDMQLRNCQLEGSIPSSLGNLFELEILDLSNNVLSGAIPSEMGKLETIKYLTLNNNGLSGTIPIQLANMMDLRTLHLNENSLTGTFPREFEALVELESLLLRDNNLRGAIPASLCSLSSLKLLTKDLGCRVECSCCTDAGACDI